MSLRGTVLLIVVFIAVSIIGLLAKTYDQYWILTTIVYTVIGSWLIWSQKIHHGFTVNKLLLVALVGLVNFLILSQLIPELSILNILASILIAPIFEEIFFRGFIYENVRGSAWWKIAIVTLLFALWHLKNLSVVMVGVSPLLQIMQVLLIIGPFFGWLRYRYNSLFPSMIAHSIYNTMAILLLPFALPLMIFIWLYLFLFDK